MEVTRKTISRRTILSVTATAIILFLVILTCISYAMRKRPEESQFDPARSDALSKSEISILNESDDGSGYIETSNNSEASLVFGESAIVDSSDALSAPANEESDVDNEIQHGWVINEYGYTYIYGASGYEQFNYKNAALERYVNSINTLASVLPKETRLFNITVPVSSTFANIPREIYIEDDFYNQSQTAFVSTVASRLDEKITNVSVVSYLEECYDNGEYVFFRTDKNWTSLGAYRAYERLCESAGFNAFSIDIFPKMIQEEFLGSFYHATRSPDMSDNPDYLECFSAADSVKTTLAVYDQGVVYTNYLLCNNDVSFSNGYNIFLGREADRYEIHSNGEDRSLLIIGDSSAYPIVPLLVSHYSRIDLVDPTKANYTLSEFLDGRFYDDCITMCYSTNAISGEFVPLCNIFTGATVDE